jgi:protein TonB
VRCTEPRRCGWLRAATRAAVLACLPWAAPAAAESPAPGAPAAIVLPAPAAARDWDEFKRSAALRLMAANPDLTYTGPVVDPLLAIPVLEVDLDRDGRVRNIRIVRMPTQAEDTVQLAIDAVMRAAPYGDMSKLPKPWKWVEIFLFDEDRRFKPRTLDE